MKRFFFSIWGVFILFFILRILPYFHNTVPLGYDAGIYLYLFKIFPNLPQWQMLGFSPGLFAFFYPIIKIGINPEKLLIPISILSQIVLFFSIYWVSKKIMGGKIAVLTSFLFTVSLVQFRTFWFFYVKNGFAMAFFLIALYFLTKKRLFVSAIFAILLGLFHLPTFLIYFLILFVLMLWDRKNFMFYVKVLVLTLIGDGIYYLPMFDRTILPFLKPLIQSIAPYRLISGIELSSGTFYSLPISFLMTVFYLPLAFLGLYIMRTKENLKPFFVGFAVLFVMVITGFFFSSRFFILFDLFLLFFAGIGLNVAIEKYNKQRDVFAFYFGVLIIFIFAFVLKTGQPLITTQILGEIKDFKGIKNSYVLSTSKEDNAWLLGYTNLRLIAWDYAGEDKYWGDNEWQDFFESVSYKKKSRLFDKLPKPLYIFINDKQIIYLEDVATLPCVKKLTDHFYQYSCDANKL